MSPHAPGSRHVLVLSASLALFILCAGIALGYFTGFATAVARRAWKDYKTTKKALPGLRKGAWATTRLAAGWIAAVTVIGLIIFTGILQTDDKPRTPAGVPSVAAS